MSMVKMSFEIRRNMVKVFEALAKNTIEEDIEYNLSEKDGFPYGEIRINGDVSDICIEKYGLTGVTEDNSYEIGDLNYFEKLIKTIAKEEIQVNNKRYEIEEMDVFEHLIELSF